MERQARRFVAKVEKPSDVREDLLFYHVQHVVEVEFDSPISRRREKYTRWETIGAFYGKADAMQFFEKKKSLNFNVRLLHYDAAIRNRTDTHPRKYER